MAPEKSTWRVLVPFDVREGNVARCPMFADAVGKHQRVALLYSGGLESSLLLHLAEPWRQQITVYTVQTGAEFPHMVAFMDRKLKDWDHRVITVDLGASFDQLGIPSSVVPIEHLQGIEATLNIEERQPRIVPWTFCCTRNRWQPGCEAIKADGIGAVIHGQRSGDYSQSVPAPLEYPGLELVAPLWTVSRESVWKGIREFGIELPDHYAEYPSSLDCSVCPSSLTTKRRAWMAKRYPEHLAVAEKLHTEVTQAVLAALDGDNTKNAFAPK
jgi:3'-phosphoadenosine 5'-phosphosulfate sulfotransferase (PAPS reductase)/FAD synthetase